MAMLPIVCAEYDSRWRKSRKWLVGNGIEKSTSVRIEQGSNTVDRSDADVALHSPRLFRTSIFGGMRWC